MEPKKRWDGYVSFSYLEAGRDYRPFDLARQIGRVEPFVYPLSAEQEERAARLLRDCVCISLHDHCGVAPVDMRENEAYAREGREWYGYEGLAASELDAVFENFMDGTATITSKAGWKWTDVLADVGMRYADVAHQSLVFRGETVDDILDAHRTGRIALISSIEAATPIENEIDRLDILYGLGIRMSGIAYSESNALGSGLKERGDGGLTDFGARCVGRMNALGMAIDVSHAGDLTALDVCRVSTKPVFVSHAGARSLWDIPRMKSDEVIKAIADTGGVFGIEAAPHTTLSAAHPLHSIESVVDHIDRVVELVGIDHVGFGPDTFFGDHVALHELYAEHLDAGEELPRERVPYVEGIENASEFPNLPRAMIARGYSDDDVAKAIGGNAIRALRDVWV